MTYKELLVILQSMTEGELSYTVTVESSVDDECYPALFKFTDDEHPSLDNKYPILYF
jgi:hypothetical protein